MNENKEMHLLLFNLCNLFNRHIFKTWGSWWGRKKDRSLKVMTLEVYCWSR